ncbi:MAG: serine/threonine-protein kinase [Myxococcaceae bacterium]
MSTQPLQFGRYELLERIAAGGMGEVYVGVQTGIGDFRRPVAVKLLLPHLADDEHIISMFLREARLAAQMQSAHIAQVFDVGFEHDRYFIAMELVRGVSLSKLIAGLKATQRQLRFEELVHVARALSDGLHVAHEQRDPDGKPLGIVHRDVTPHNVLVSVDGVVKLTDFGIARVAEGDRHSKPGVVLGKLGYLAPEQMRGQPLDRRVDVFAAGATLFHLAALEKPFDTPTGQLLDPGRLPRAPLRVFRPDLPRDFIDVIERAMAVDPDARFATARDLRNALPDAPSQDEALGTLVREVCGAALVDLDRKTEHVTRSHGTAAVTRDVRPPARPELATPRPPEGEASVSLAALRPSRGPWILGLLGLVAGIVALVVSTQPAASENAARDAGVAEVTPPTPPVVTAPPQPAAIEDAGKPSKTEEPARPAYVSIDATPWGQVTVDGKKRGDTPVLELRLSAGEHQLKVVNPETGKSATQKLVLKSGETRAVRVDLR